jgi:hypothetical protein
MKMRRVRERGADQFLIIFFVIDIFAVGVQLELSLGEKGYKGCVCVVTHSLTLLGVLSTNFCQLLTTNQDNRPTLEDLIFFIFVLVLVNFHQLTIFIARSTLFPFIQLAQRNYLRVF